jgi:hypothetical protein
LVALRGGKVNPDILVKANSYTFELAQHLNAVRMGGRQPIDGKTAVVIRIKIIKGVGDKMQ